MRFMGVVRYAAPRVMYLIEGNPGKPGPARRSPLRAMYAIINV